MTDLLPCPFCGSADHLRYEFAGSQGYICCDNCCTEGPCDERAADPICDMDAAHDAWNRRAALAQPEPEGATQPVPVSERLPGPGDCDAEGRCWWWRPSHPESGYSEGWMLRPWAWGSGRYDFDDCLMHTYWLPAHALPLPTRSEND